MTYSALRPTAGWLLAALLLPLPVAAASVTLDATVDADPRIAGPGELTVLIRNPGEQAVVLPAAPDWDAAGRLTIEVRAPNGAVSAMAVTPSAAVDAPYSLAGGATLAVSRVLEADAFAEAGTYEVVVRYSGVAGSPGSEAIQVVVAD